MASYCLDDNIREFCDDGVTVIENVFTDEEVAHIRQGLHAELLTHNIDHTKVLSGEQVLDSNLGPRIKGVTSRFYYGKWKIDAQANEKVYNIMKEFINRTFGKEGQGLTLFQHPFGYSDDVVPYIDRVCWRLPDHIRHEGGLGLHMDRNPVDPYLLDRERGGEGLTRWRPIQSFITLTDHFTTDSGGLKVVKGFHKICDGNGEGEGYFSKDPELKQLASKGEFFRMHSKKYAKLADKLQPIFAKKGSIVLWDNRLPHVTAEHLIGSDSREVIYMSYLPNVDLNKRYFINQIANLKKNIDPPSYLESDKEIADRNWRYPQDLDTFQKKLLS